MSAEVRFEPRDVEELASTISALKKAPGEERRLDPLARAASLGANIG